MGNKTEPKKIAIIGFFAFNSTYNGGQENKTRAIGELLDNQIGSSNIIKIDTLNWKKKPIKFLLKVFKECRNCKYIIMMPAQNGVRVFSRLLLIFRGHNAKLYYSVIGGWLPELTKRSNCLSRYLKRFNGIWVETGSMYRELTQQGFNNVKVIPNFKVLEYISPNELNDKVPHVLKLCTFSRVLKEKGIEEAISVVKEINETQGQIVYTLDIYGPIDVRYKERFGFILKTLPDYIKYKGVVSSNDSVKVLKDYFALVFPTHYYTEGVPGTIIDAYAAGLPVIAAKWESYSDVIKEGVTGIGYEFDDYYDMKLVLEYIANNPNKITNLKRNCLMEYENYTEKNVTQIIAKELNIKGGYNGSEFI